MYMINKLLQALANLYPETKVQKALKAYKEQGHKNEYYDEDDFLHGYIMGLVYLEELEKIKQPKSYRFAYRKKLTNIDHIGQYTGFKSAIDRRIPIEVNDSNNIMTLTIRPQY